MKIKTDFVTNSSTTSFVVIGVRLDLSDVPEDFIKAIAEEHQLDPKTLMDSENRYSFPDYFTKGSDLAYSFGSEYDEQLMIGIRYSEMNDDETLLDFKNRVQLQILEKFGVPVRPHHIEEAWRDG